MLELILIASLSWFGYTQHERAVKAEVKLSNCSSELIGLNNMVIHWETKAGELEDGQEKYENRIKELAEQTSKQQSDLEKLRDAGGRDSDYINTPIPDGVWELIKGPNTSNKD